MTPIDLIILALATWRISHMLVWEDGPFKIFSRMNAWMERNKFLIDLFSCEWCLSVWIGAILALSAIINKTVTVYVLLPFALSAVAIFITEHLNGKG